VGGAGEYRFFGRTRYSKKSIPSHRSGEKIMKTAWDNKNPAALIIYTLLAIMSGFQHYSYQIAV
jgi:hypothetical protein